MMDRTRYESDSSSFVNAAVEITRTPTEELYVWGQLTSGLKCTLTIPTSHAAHHPKQN